MANYDQNRGYQSYEDDRDREMNRRRYNKQDEYNRENYGSYGNASFENDYNRQGKGGNYGNTNTGYGSFYNEKNWRREMEDERNPNMRNVSYGDVYHGNVERREWETDQAQGGRYANRGMSRGRDYENDYGRTYRQGGYGSYQGSNYGDQGSNYGNRGNYENYENMNRRREDRDWWDRAKDEMKSWTGDDDAERRREMDKRMAGEHRGKGPRGYSRSEERIREDVCERLSDDSYVDASDIDIKVEGGVVVLSGTVNSREEKRRAEDIVESTSGVHDVENRLKVNQRAYDNDNDNYGRYGRGNARRANFGDYTGTSDDASGIGRSSGTTNEVIRDVNGQDEIR